LKRLPLLILPTVFLLLPVCRKLGVNRRPDRPGAPDGPGCVNVLVDTSYYFLCGTTDPDGDSLRYRVDWGDGDTSDWTEPERNGTSVLVSHAWHSTGPFLVRAQAIDEDGSQSDWSEATTTSLAFAWRQTYGGAGDDEAASVQQTYEGGYIVVGTTNSLGAGMTDIWLLRVDERGERVWDKTFGGSADDRGRSVRQTYDGTFVIAGSTNSKGAGGSDAWLIKTDLDGNVIWDRTFGGPGSDDAVAVRQTFDGGFVVAGVTCSDGAGDENVWLIRTDASGNPVWSRTYGSAGSDVAASVRQTSDRGYVIVGTTDSYGSGGKDIWLVKTDSFGDVLWTKTFGGIEDDYAGSGIETPEGGYAIVGTRGTNGGDVWVIKTDAEGGLLWSETDRVDYEDHGAWIELTAGGDYVIVGYTYSSSLYHYASDVLMELYSAFGNDVSGAPCGELNDDEYAACTQQTNDGGLIIAGNTRAHRDGQYDFWLIKTGQWMYPVW
jgi:hypothetical protein